MTDLTILVLIWWTCGVTGATLVTDRNQPYYEVMGAGDAFLCIMGGLVGPLWLLVYAILTGSTYLRERRRLR